MQSNNRTQTTANTLSRSVVVALLVALSFYTLVQLSAPGKTAFASGTITGTVFQDFNGDGTFNTTASTGVSKDLHVAGVTVTAYDSSGTARGTTTTVRCTAAATPSSFCTGADTGPNYSLSATGTGPYRIEFTWTNTSGALLDFQPSSRSTDSVNGGTSTNSGSTTQYVADGNTSNVNLALNRTCDYCQNNPKLVTTRFENGLRTSNTNASIISMAYNPASHTNDEQIQNTGAVWGVAYDGSKKRVYTSAFLKRHVDLGPRGMDGVYVMDYSSGTASLLGGFDLQGVTATNGGTIDLGTVTRGVNSDNTLGAAGTANIDLDAFGKVGKTGFGDIDFAGDGKSLWMVNLYQRTLIKVDTSKVTVNTNNPNTISGTAVTQYEIITSDTPTNDSNDASIPDITGAPSCSNGQLRPFALKIRGTLGYLGVTCDAATSATVDNPSELIGYVLSFNLANPTSFTQLLSVPFNYNREPYYQMLTNANRVDAGWQKWMDTWTDAQVNTPATAGCCNDFRSAPSPLLSDIEFMSDGSLTLGIVDRFSHQSGWVNRKALSGDATTLMYGSAGDVLYAKLNSNGTYTLESGENDQGDPFQVADRVGYRTDDSPGNAGEYYYGDAYTGADATHGETTLGSLAYLPGADRIFSPAYDPTAFYTQGLIWQAVTPPTGVPGAQIGAYAVVDSSPFNSPNEFGKANGMGDMELLCDAAPIEIGNRVWRDDDGDGIQDPGEMAMAGLTVQLWADTDGDGTVDTQVGTATTDANGEYYFGGSSKTNMLSYVGGSATVSTRIAQSSDDAEQTVSSGSVTITSGTLNVPRSTTATQLDGLRFQNITILQGATITNATIQFTANNSDTSTTINALIRGEAATNAATFAATNNNISSRATTSASVAWSSIGSWTSGATTNATTPDLTTVVQEIVNQGGWASGNSMSFIISDNSSTSGTQRRAYSYDSSSADAPLLSVTYQTSTPYSIAPGNAYQVRVDPSSGSNTNLLNGLTVTTQNAAQPANGNASATNNNSITDVADNDASKSGNNFVINITTGDTGANNHSLDFGFAPLGAIGNRVWLDEDSNGYQDEGEDGIPNVTVTLYDSAGNALATKVTDSNGNYLFTGLAAGTYFVRVTSGITSGLTQTTIYPNANVDLFNQDQSTGTNDYGYQVTLSAGQDNLTADFGYNWNPTADVNSGTQNATAALGDRVWIDTNGNGRQDAGEVGVRGATVSLYYDGGNDGVYDDLYTVGGYTATRTTDQNGNYIFDGLPPGAYVVQVTSDSGASHAILTSGQYNQRGDPDHWGTSTGTNDNKTTTPVILGPGDVFLDADFGYQPNSASLGSIGNYIWFDRDGDGVGPNVDADGAGSGAAEQHGASGTADSTEEGIGGISVSLIRDLDDDGVWDAGEPIIATQFTSDGTQDVDGDGNVDAKGAYRFRGLNIADDTGNNRNDYLVVVTDVNHVLDGLRQTYDQDSPTSDGQSRVQNLSATAVTTEDFGYTPDNSGQQSSRTTLNLDANTGMIGNFVWFDVDGDGVGPNGNGSAGNDNNELGIPNVRVYLYDSTGTTLLATTYTGPDGYYLFPNLTAGGTSYVVRVDTSTLPGGSGAWDQTYDVDGTGTANQSTEASLTDGEVNLTHDFGYRGQDDGSNNRGSIGNLIWNDVNADGNVDSFGTVETGINNVTVDLYWDTDRDGKIDPGEPRIATTTTDSSGAYSFTGLAVTDGVNGDARYVVDVSDRNGVLAGYWHSLGNQSSSSDNESKTDPYAVTLTPSNRTVNTVDFGYYVLPAAIGNYVWNDTNANGIQEAGETGINNVVVQLTITYPGPNGAIGGGDDTVTTIRTVTGDDPSTTGTTEVGWYSFANLLQDEDYNGANSAALGEPTFSIAVVTQPGSGALTNFAKTNTDQGSGGSQDLLDSDNHDGVSATATEGSRTVTQQALGSSEGTLASYDFGYTAPVNLGDRIWYDSNNNGTFDVGEVGINGVTVRLYRDTNGNGTFDSASDTLVATTTTANVSGNDGTYNFTLLTPSIAATANTQYFVVLPDTNFTSGGTLQNYQNSSNTVGANSDTNNSDHGQVNGTLGATNGVVVTNGSVSVTLGGEPTNDGDGNNGNLTIDMGFYRLQLSGTVFIDSNNDGDLDAGETPSNGAESGLTVRLYRDDDNNNVADGAAIATTTTDSSGNYTFNNLSAGRYIVGVVQPSAYHSTIDTASQADTDDPNSVGTNGNDNGYGTAGGEIRSRNLNLTAGSTSGGSTVTNSTGLTSNDRLDFGLSNSPTSVEMGALIATANTDGSVTLAWETLNELDILGFNVLRGESKKEVKTQVNGELLPAQSVGSITGNGYTFSDTSVVGEKTYFYRIELVRPDGRTAKSELVKVTTLAGACSGEPQAPTLTGPGDGKKVKKGKVVFTWDAVECAVNYKWQLRQDSPDGELLASKRDLTETTTSLKKLNVGATYVWRVAACSGAGQCTWSEWSSIEIRAPKEKKDQSGKTK